MFIFPDFSYKELKSMVESLPHAFETSHSRKHYILEGFVDDFGNIVIPGTLDFETYSNRYEFFKS